MYKIIHTVFWGLGVLVFVTTAAAKEWRGITPMKSTRADVERLMGLSEDSNEIRSIYRMDNEEVFIVFSGNQFCTSKNIAPGTVLLVQITPRQKPDLSVVQIDRKKFREFRPSAQDPNWLGLIDEEDGMIVRSYHNRVDKFFYFAAAKEKLLCPEYYAEPETFAQIVVDFNSRVFDSYSELAFDEEKGRLDNFAIYLQKQKPTWKGYIVVYPKHNDMTDARSRSEKAKKYLISLGLDATRISTIIGSTRNKLAIELQAQPSDLPPPRPGND